MRHFSHPKAKDDKIEMPKLTICPKPHHLIQSKALPAAHGGWELESRRGFRTADSRLVIYTCVIIYLASSFTHVGMLARKCTEKRLQIVSPSHHSPLVPLPMQRPCLLRRFDSERLALAPLYFDERERA